MFSMSFGQLTVHPLQLVDDFLQSKLFLSVLAELRQDAGTEVELLAKVLF
jgi:hypothetical protein